MQAPYSIDLSRIYHRGMPRNWNISGFGMDPRPIEHFDPTTELDDSGLFAAVSATPFSGVGHFHHIRAHIVSELCVLIAGEGK